MTSMINKRTVCKFILISQGVICLCSCEQRKTTTKSDSEFKKVEIGQAAVRQTEVGQIQVRQIDTLNFKLTPLRNDSSKVKHVGWQTIQVGSTIYPAVSTIFKAPAHKNKLYLAETISSPRQPTDTIEGKNFDSYEQTYRIDDKQMIIATGFYGNNAFYYGNIAVKEDSIFCYWVPFKQNFNDEQARGPKEVFITYKIRNANPGKKYHVVFKRHENLDFKFD